MKSLSFSDKALEIEKVCLTQEQVSCPVIHRFGPGVYIREVLLPAGTFAVGHHQNFEHTNVFLKGKVTVLNEDGSTSDLVAPMVFVGRPGRKIGYVHEDVVWLNVYSTEEKDVEKLESHFLTKSEEWTDAIKNQVKQLCGEVDKEDFLNAIQELGFSEESVREQSEQESDMVDLPYGNYKFKIGNSCIDGKGIFSTANISTGEVLAPSRIGKHRTILGRYTNHSASPNAKMELSLDGNIYLVAIKNIQGCFGGHDGEEITIDYRQAIEVNKKSMEVLCLE